MDSKLAMEVRLGVSRLRRLGLALTRRDPQESFYLLHRIGAYLSPEYRFKQPHLAWWEDEDFTQFLRDFGELDGYNAERRWTVQQLIRLTVDVPGDTAECGAYKGTTSFLIARMNAASGRHRTHHAIDSFEGLSQPNNMDGAHWRAGHLTISEEDCRRNLERFGDAVLVHKGWIPEVLQFVNRGPYAFVHIDVDLYQPTKDSLEFFYPLLSPGAVLVCDDYGSTKCPGALKACEEFLADKPERMIATAAGSGFFIKGTGTQPALYPLGRQQGA